MKSYLKIFALLVWCSAAVAEVSPAIKKIQASDIPPAYGAYSQGVLVDMDQVKQWVFLSGQVPVDHEKGVLISSDIREATKQTMKNIEAVLKAAGTDFQHVVRTDVFLKNFDRDWEGMNETYAQFFPADSMPARQTIQADLPHDTLVEISCIAIVPIKAVALEKNEAAEEIAIP